MSLEQYAFIAEWTDPVSSYRREFNLFYFTLDETIELRDVKSHQLFLKRIKCNGITLEDFYIGARLKIFSRLMKIIDYGDLVTKNVMNTSAQRALGIIQPEILNKKGSIIDTILNSKLKIVNMMMVEISKKRALKLYEDFKDVEDFPLLVHNILSGPILVFELVGVHSVARWKELVGPQDPREAKISAPDSLRGRFGVDKVKNAIYIPSTESTEKMIESYFPTKMGQLSDVKLCAQFCNSTCCVIKPHAIKEGNMAGIMSMIEDFEFRVTGIRMLHLTIEQAESFYEIYKHVVPEYQNMVKELSDGLCIAMEIVSTMKDTTEEFRKFVGPRDPQIAQKIRPNTLRAKFGKTVVQNAVHVTDLSEDAEWEVKHFFRFLPL